jgi:multidrug efflux system outer membrane protein
VKIACFLARFIFLVSVFLSGCAVGPNYKRPSVNTPAAFRAPSGTKDQQTSLADLPWWDLFHDETLKGLVKSSLTNNYLATEEARRGVMLTLASEVSQAYFELLGLRYQLDIAKETTESYATTFKLFSKRQHEGIGNELQTSSAAADLATAAASVPELERLIALKENEINVLTGQNPGTIETKSKLLEEVIPPEVPAGLPSALLERRRDVLSAAQTVRSANAQIGIAQAVFFPAIGLTTFFGKLSTPLSELSSGNTNAWSLASTVTGPIFHAGGLKAQKRQAIAHWQEARAQYLQTALGAFRDVSDALISRENYDNIRAKQIEAVRANQEAVRLVRMRYIEGLSSYLEVLDALQRLYPAQLSLAQTEVNRRLVVVQLYKALGGGWNLTDEQFMTAGSLPGGQSPRPGNLNSRN